MDIDLCWLDWHDTGNLVAVCNLAFKDNVMSEQGLTELTVRHQHHSRICPEIKREPLGSYPISISLVT